MTEIRQPPAGDLFCLVMMAVFALGLLVLAVRLKDVQVDETVDYAQRNLDQSVRRVQTVGARGRILDRCGRVLAGNRRSVSIVCRADAFRRRTEEATIAAIVSELARLADVLSLPPPAAEQAVRRHVAGERALPLVAWRDIAADELARFCERESEFPGFAVVETSERTYPNGSVAAHLIGYVGRDYASSEAGDRRFDYRERELRGREGVECYYDSFLKGVPGEKNITVDAAGYATEEKVVTPTSDGPDLMLTLDFELQRTVERELAGERGACVVLDPRDGSVLAMASAPSWDANRFVPVLRQELYAALEADPSKPRLNRAVAGTYAPGSTFKPLTALAGLSSGLSPDEKYHCSGIFEYGGMHLRCAKRWGHGPLAMREALRDSCNAYFCNLGCAAGTNAIVTTARLFGLGAKTGIDFPLDAAGVVPDAEWKQDVYRERWFAGDLVQMSIGQGMLLVTPLQMARVVGALGSGRLVTPRLSTEAPVSVRTLDVPRAHLAVVRKGMRMVVDGGTGRRGGEGIAAFVIGKTGTAEVGVGERRRKNTWFIAYAVPDASTPAAAKGREVAVAMVIENGASGGVTTAPKVRNVLAGVYGTKGGTP